MSFLGITQPKTTPLKRGPLNLSPVLGSAEPSGSRLQEGLDVVGATLSFGCAIHCMVLPLVISILPLLGLSILGDHRFEQFMFATTIAIASLSLCWGVRRHGERRILGLLLAAIAFFAIGGFEAHSTREALFVGFGGLCLATAHLVNRRLCNSCATCHDP